MAAIAGDRWHDLSHDDSLLNSHRSVFSFLREYERELSTAPFDKRRWTRQLVVCLEPFQPLELPRRFVKGPSRHRSRE